MTVICACDCKLISVYSFKCVNAKFYAWKELSYGFLNRHLFLNCLFRFLRILKILPSAGHKFLEDTVLKFKAHCAVVIHSRSQSFDKIRIIIAWMELYKFHLFFLFVWEKRVIIKIAVADDVCSNFLREIGFPCTRSAAENQIFWFNQHRGERISISLKLLDKLFLDSSLSYSSFRLFLVLFTVSKNELISWLTKPFQAFLHKNNGWKDVPAINDKLPAVIITIGQILYCVAMLFKLIYTGINSANHITIRVIPADGEALLFLNRQRGKLLLKHLTGDTRHSLIWISTFALAVGAFDDCTIRFFEISIQRLIVVTEA